MSGDGQSRTTVVGEDRDPVRIAAKLAEGITVLVAGPQGSGKSHLLNAVAEELRARGVVALRVRPGRRLRDVPMGALLTVPGDQRQLLEQEPDGRGGAHLIAIVDDGQELDMESADVILRAVYWRRSAALISLDTPRFTAAPRHDAGPAADAIASLWLSGAAERLDLRDLTTAEAFRLLELVPGTARLDSVTRATVVDLCDGSRTLLRELAAHFVASLDSAADPRAGLSALPRHSRLGDAVTAHMSEFDVPELQALAFLGRLPHIEYADAVKFLSPLTVDALLSSERLREDGTVCRRLIANTVLAREADHQSGTASTDRAVESAAERMLGAGGTWWSTPLAIVVARRWLGEGGIPDMLRKASPELRARIALDAARHASENGDPALGGALAALGLQEYATPALAVESAYAESIVARADGAASGPPVDVASLDPDTLKRLMRAEYAVGRSGMRLPALSTADAPDDPARAEILVAAGDRAALDLRWTDALAAFSEAATAPGAAASTRLRAVTCAAAAGLQLGQWRAASEWVDAAAHLIDTASAPATMSLRYVLFSLVLQIHTFQLAGLDTSGFDRRLRLETVMAARSDDQISLALAGYAATLVAAGTGDAGRLTREIDTANRRSAHLPLGPHITVVQLAVARALALLDRPQDARRIVGGIAGLHETLPPLIAYALAATESCILVAEGRLDDARHRAADALQSIEDTDARLLRMRGMYQLAALQGADEPLLDRMRFLGSTFDLPLARAATERVSDLLRSRRNIARRTPLELLRLLAPWREGGMDGLARTSLSGPRPWDAGPSSPGTAAGASLASMGLTRREREIATLVGEGLSNREIAERLFLSVRTVESHVYEARAKVAARSRADLGRMVARESLSVVAAAD